MQHNLVTDNECARYAATCKPVKHQHETVTATANKNKVVLDPIRIYKF